MKLEVIEGEKTIGELQVSLLPGVSHKFKLGKKVYEIIKVTNTMVQVVNVPEDHKPKAFKDSKKKVNSSG